MCGRYTIRNIDRFIQLAAFEALVNDIDTRVADMLPRFNVAPSQEVPIVHMTADDVCQIGLAKWGLIPSWTKGDPKLTPINARSETVATSGMFRGAYNKHRCLVLADGFYEWKKIDSKTKQPTFIHMKDDQPFAFAGLREQWTPENSSPIQTCTILTTTPNDLMKDIHDRMPVILPREHFARWIDTKILGVDVADLLVPFDANLMEAYSVSSSVNVPKNQGPDLIKPL